MTPFAVDLALPFATDHLIHKAMRTCDLKVRHQFRVPKEEMDAQVMELLAGLDLTITHAEAFFTPPHQILPIHVDGPALNDITKLNWSWGADDAWMMWWKLKDGIEPTQLVTKIGTRYLTMEARNCIPIHRHRVKRPTLVNVGRPHSILNNTPHGRWVLSLVLWDLRTDTALQMPEALERFNRMMSEPVRSAPVAAQP